MPETGGILHNAYEIIETPKAQEIHFSAKDFRKNKMQNFDLFIGSRSEANNQVIQMCLNEVLNIKEQLKQFT